MIRKTAECINILARFCGTRDIAELTTEQINHKYGIKQVDVFALFGGSILCGGDVLAQAIQNHIAKKYIIVGGAGHTTETFRQKVHTLFPTLETSGKTEAEVYDMYLAYKYGLHADLLECQSTNCGNNVTYLLELLEANSIRIQSLLIAQDATMQCRMDAGFRKYLNQSATIINYATYQAEVIVKDDKLAFQDDILGMWDMDRYISLLMGEIPRLTDDAKGYGPKGKDFIAHVDVPTEVISAFQTLCNDYSQLVRDANPLFASPKEKKEVGCQLK